MTTGRGTPRLSLLPDSLCRPVSQTRRPVVSYTPARCSSRTSPMPYAVEHARTLRSHPRRRRRRRAPSDRHRRRQGHDLAGVGPDRRRRIADRRGVERRPPPRRTAGALLCALPLARAGAGRGRRGGGCLRRPPDDARPGRHPRGDRPGVGGPGAVRARGGAQRRAHRRQRLLGAHPRCRRADRLRTKRALLGRYRRDRRGPVCAARLRSRRGRRTGRRRRPRHHRHLALRRLCQERADPLRQPGRGPRPPVSRAVRKRGPQRARPVRPRQGRRTGGADRPRGADRTVGRGVPRARDGLRRGLAAGRRLRGAGRPAGGGLARLGRGRVAAAARGPGGRTSRPRAGARAGHRRTGLGRAARTRRPGPAGAVGRSHRRARPGPRSSPMRSPPPRRASCSASTWARRARRASWSSPPAAPCWPTCTGAPTATRSRRPSVSSTTCGRRGRATRSSPSV